MIRWGLRVLIALGIAVVAAYCLIPAERLGAYMTSTMSANSPKTAYSCRAARLGFPPGMVFEQFRIDFRKKSQPGIEVQTLRLTPRLVPLLTGRMSFGVRAASYGGQVNGTVDYLRYATTVGPLDAAFHLADLDVARCAWLRAATGMPLTGRLRGAVDFSGETAAFAQGTGQARLTLQGCRLPVVRGLGNLGTAEFDTVELNMVLDRGVMRVERLFLGGKGVQSVLRGHVLLKEDLRDSALSLSGTLVVKTLARFNLKFVVTGTLAHPAVSVM